jgi:hypothetical protein
MAPKQWGTRYGNSWHPGRLGMAVMAVLGTATAGIVVSVMSFNHDLARDWSELFAPLLIFASVFVVILSPTLMFSIWLGGGRVRHVFLNTYVLSDLPVSDFEDMLLAAGGVRGRHIAAYAGFTNADFDPTPSGPWAATLYFKHDRRIRFFGAHMRIMRSLKDALIAAKRQA